MLILSNKKNIGLWFKERFPAINFSTALLMILFAKSTALLEEKSSWNWQWQDLGCFLLIASHLFLLRVFDEHKDHQSDQINHPERVIQKGLVSLTEIKILGAFAFVIQILGFLLIPFQMTNILLWLGIWGWTFLMTKEFFAKDWLRSKLFIYSFLHLLISPALVLSIFSFYQSGDSSPAIYYFVFGVLFSSGWFYELTRKNKAPSEETKDITFSNLWGIQKSTYAQFLIFNIFITLSLGYFSHLMLLNITSLAILVFIYFLTSATLFNFMRNPNIKNRKKSEGCVALSSGFVLIYPLIRIFFP